MQINRIQSNFNALNQINSQKKFSSNPQNTDLRQTTNHLYNYSIPLSFGMFKRPKVLDINTELGNVINKFQKKLLKGDYIAPKYKHDQELIDFIKFEPNNGGNEINNKLLKLSHLFEGIVSNNKFKIKDDTKAEELANEILVDVQSLGLKRDFLMTSLKENFNKTPLMSVLWFNNNKYTLSGKLIDWLEELGVEDQKYVLNMQDGFDRTHSMLVLRVGHKKAAERILNITEKLGKEDTDFLKTQLTKQETYTVFEPSPREEKGGWTILEHALWRHEPQWANRILDMAENVGKTDKNFLKEEYHSIKMDTRQENHLETAEWYKNSWEIPQQIIDRIKTQMAA